MGDPERAFYAPAMRVGDGSDPVLVGGGAVLGGEVDDEGGHGLGVAQ